MKGTVSEIIERAYLGSPIFLKQIALWFYGYRLRRLRYGGQLSDEYTIQFLENKSRDWIDDYQLMKINEILAVACLTKFFQGRLPLSELESLDDISKLPILTKNEIRGHAHHFLNPKIPNRHRVMGQTSGSTGTPIAYYHSIQSFRKMSSLFRSFRRYHGIHNHDKKVRFGGRLIIPYEQKKPPFWITDYANNTLYLSLLHFTETNMIDFVTVIADFQAREFSGYPSSIYLLAEYCLRHQIDKLRPWCVITDSETLLDYQRVTIEQAFQCSVVDYYGISETEGILAGQCHYGNYHLIPQSAYVEVLDQKGNPLPNEVIGNIHVTSLTNDCFPLIRYQVGDLGAISTELCNCGLQTRLLKGLEGRIDDVVTTPEGRKIGRLDHLFKCDIDIREAQIVQEEQGVYHFNIVPGETFSNNTIDSMRKSAERRLGKSSQLTFQIVPEIPRTVRGKFQSVIVKK